MLSAKQLRLPNFHLGEHGERRAANFLVSLNYQILDTNVRLGTHEIDLIARDMQTGELVFVEVKTRSSAAFGSPTAAVSKKKVHSLRAVARQYMREKRISGDYRFDIVAVLPDTIDHYQNITWNF